MSIARRDGKLAGLVGEDSVSDIVHFRVNVFDFASTELVRVHFLEGLCFDFRRSDILSRLVEVSFGGFYGFRVVLLDVFDGKEGPSNCRPGLP